MLETKEKKEVSFTDYLSVLLKWKKFLIINLLIITIGATIYSFMIPKTYKAVTTLMIPEGKDNGLGSLLGNSTFSFGAQLLGGGSTSEDLIMGILNSRTVLSKVANKFNLYNYYEVEDHNYDLLMKSFSGDIIFTINEFGFIEVHVINKSPEMAADIANYFAYLADSLNIKLNIEQAKNNRMFVEKRFLKTKEDIKKAEEEYYKFQKEYSAYEIPEQVKVSVQAAAELESDLFKKEILLNSIKEKVSSSSPTYKDLEQQIEATKNKLKEFYSKKNDTSIFVSFEDVPELQLKYVRLYREMEIQNKILEFIYPMYEQAKIDEKKNSPTLITVDKAVPPQLKYAPKKSFVIIIIVFPVFFLLLMIIFRGEKIMRKMHVNNSFEELERKVYKRLVRIYHLNIPIND